MAKNSNFLPVIRSVEKSIDKNSQTVLIPDIEIDDWGKSLNHAERDHAANIALYRGQWTSWQSHSNIQCVDFRKLNIDALKMTLKISPLDTHTWSV